MTEFGIFGDDGMCLEGGFFSRDAAEAALSQRYAGDDASVEPICRDHEDQPATACAECNCEVAS